MARAQGVTNKQLGAIQKKANAVSTGIGASFARTGTQIAAALLTGKVASSLASLSEAGTRIDNSLKVAGLSGAELEKVYQSLSKAALANGAPIETLAALYGKAAQAQKELGVTSEELLGFTNNVALALRVAGTDAQTASGALLQLGQALGAGQEVWFRVVGSDAKMVNDQDVSALVAQAETARDAAMAASPAGLSTLAELKAADHSILKRFYLSELGKEGWFTWRDGDYTSLVALDPSNGVYVKANDTPASFGAFQREVDDGKYLATWFGLVEGESANNHIAIKNAIVVAASIRPVVIPPGDYTLTAGITNNQQNTHLIGYRAVVRANFAGILFRSLSPYSRPTIEGFVFDGLNVATRGLWLSANHAHVFNNEIKGFNDAALLIGGDASTNTQNPRVHDNYVHDNAGIGIGFSRASRAAAIGNIIRNSGLHAMTMDNVGGAYNIVANNVMDTACTVAGSAVFATDLSQHLIVANNHIANGTTWGITTPNNEGHTDGMIIVGNAIVNNQSGGIKLLRNNAPTGAGAPGPVLCSNCLIDGNTFVNNGPSKISIVIDDMGTTLGPNQIGANNLYRDSALPSYPSRTLGTPVTFFATYSADQADVTGDGTDFTMVRKRQGDPIWRC